MCPCARYFSTRRWGGQDGDGLEKCPGDGAELGREGGDARFRRQASRTNQSRLRPSSSSSYNNNSGLCTGRRCRVSTPGRELRSLPLGRLGTAAAAYLPVLSCSLRPRTASSSSPPGRRRSTPGGTAASCYSFSPRTLGHFSSTSSSSRHRNSSCPSQPPPSSAAVGGVWGQQAAGPAGLPPRVLQGLGPPQTGLVSPAASSPTAMTQHQQQALLSMPLPPPPPPGFRPSWGWWGGVRDGPSTPRIPALPVAVSGRRRSRVLQTPSGTASAEMEGT
ncbi:unnamed protein product [Ectocarpus fasciculatus]